MISTKSWLVENITRSLKKVLYSQISMSYREWISLEQRFASHEPVLQLLMAKRIKRHKTVNLVKKMFKVRVKLILKKTRKRYRRWDLQDGEQY